jgi:hypothetical protein
LIEFRLHREKRAAFDPAVADALVFCKAMLIVGGEQKLIGFPEAVPLFFGEGVVPTGGYVIVHGDDVERRSVSGGVRIGIAFEPVHEICALRNFVGDFAVLALEFADEGERGARGGKITRSVESERGPEGIAPEKPGEAGALARAGCAVAGDEPRAEKGISDEALELADARPVVGLLDLGVGNVEIDGAGEIVLVILCGLLLERGVIGGEMLVAPRWKELVCDSA